MRETFVPILASALRVFETIANESGGESVNSIARKLKLSPASCARIVKTFQATGWLVPRPTGGFELSAGLARYLQPLWPVENLRSVAAEPLRQLVFATGFSAKVSVRQGWNAVTVVRRDGPGPITINSPDGSSFPLAFGSSGATLAAELTADQVEACIRATPAEAWRHQGVDAFKLRIESAKAGKPIIDQGSFHPHIHSVSMPILEHGKVRAAITVLGLPGFIENDLPAVTKAMRQAVSDCESALGGI